jgi:hypothetical protein
VRASIPAAAIADQFSIATNEVRALLDRGKNADHGEHRGEHVGDRDADSNRRVAGLSTGEHRARQSLDDHVHCLAAGLAVDGLGRAEAGERGEDDPRIDLGAGRVADAEPVGGSGGEILDHHVGLFDQIEEHLAALRVLEVERDPVLPAGTGEMR